MKEISIQEIVSILRNNYRLKPQEIADYLKVTREGLYYCMKVDNIANLQFDNKVIDRRQALLDLVQNPNNGFKKIENVYK